MQYLVSILNVLHKSLDEILRVCRDERKCRVGVSATRKVASRNQRLTHVDDEFHPMAARRGWKIERDIA
jgi:hypothetical protein